MLKWSIRNPYYEGNHKNKKELKSFEEWHQQLDFLHRNLEMSFDCNKIEIYVQI